MPLPQTTHSTYADYLTWDTEQKYELFDGVAVMQARPSIQHQNIEGALLQQLRNFLDGKPCRVFAEIEVLLPNHANQSADDVSTVYVPDLAVICDPNKLREQYCFGAPTVVMEILSPSTAKADRLVKLNRYQQADRNTGSYRRRNRMQPCLCWRTACIVPLPFILKKTPPQRCLR